MKNFFYLIGLVLFLTISCKKDIVEVNSGIYRGTFYLINSSDDTLNEGLCNLAIFDHNNTFSLQGDTATGVPKNCGGNYSLTGTTMTFENTANISGEFFDQNLYLDTVYQYKFSDTASVFNLDLSTDLYSYSYKLKRN